MKRTVLQLSQKVYDIVIIGGGIYGASVARDAALRGLKVALVEQGDFGSATSANNHKIIHGGLRYLQHADLKRMRESIRERSILFRIAPHLVQPLPFLVPTYGHFLKGKPALWAALKLNDLISFDRNRNLVHQKRISRGRVLSKAECLQLCPGLDQKDLTGGALYFDGQVYNPDRLNLSLLLSAASAGADLANYVQVNGFLLEGNTVTGVQAKDVLSVNRLEVRGRVVVNCSGPWTDRVLQLLGTPRHSKQTNLLKAFVLVTRPLVQGVAVGVPSSSPYKDNDAIINKGHRYFFITPWRNTSLIGTFQAPYDGDPDDFDVTEQDVRGFIHEVNAAFPGAGLKRHDVYFVYRGLLPAGGMNGKAGDTQPAKEYEIHDHASKNRIQGLVSVIGVKYTTARDVAEKTVNLVEKKLGKRTVRCHTATTPVFGGEFHDFEEFASQAYDKKPAVVSAETIQHLLQTYGSQYREILRYYEEDPAWGEPVTNGSPLIKAEVIHGIREEMAQKLGDIIFRRTELGTAGYPGDACLRTCAQIVATELGWDKERTQKELEEVRSVFSMVDFQKQAAILSD